MNIWIGGYDLNWLNSVSDEHELLGVGNWETGVESGPQDHCVHQPRPLLPLYQGHREQGQGGLRLPGTNPTETVLKVFFSFVH